MTGLAVMTTAATTVEVVEVNTIATLEIRTRANIVVMTVAQTDAETQTAKTAVVKVTTAIVATIVVVAISTKRHTRSVAPRRRDMADGALTRMQSLWPKKTLPLPPPLRLLLRM